jgi:hypothetical protein
MPEKREDDEGFRKGRKLLYAKVEEMLQDMRIMAREPFCHHRNIVRLLGLSWECVDDCCL